MGRKQARRRPRTFVFEGDAETGTHLLLSPEESRHALRVLRLRPGAEMMVSADTGLYACRLASVLGEEALVRVERRIDVEEQVAIAPVLALALAHGAAGDLAVRAATELGAARIIPLVTARGERLSAEKLAHRVARWRRIVREAVKQCGRPAPPVVSESMTLAALREHPAPVRLYFSPRAEERLGDSSLGIGAPLLVIGPEGGLAKGEEELLRDAGFRALRLPGHVLRVPTAVAAGLALLQGKLVEERDVR